MNRKIVYGTMFEGSRFVTQSNWTGSIMILYWLSNPSMDGYAVALWRVKAIRANQ